MQSPIKNVSVYKLNLDHSGENTGLHSWYFQLITVYCFKPKVEVS